MNFLDERLPDRFWSKVIPEPNSGCWLWLGAKAGGYGQIRVRSKAVSVHRLAYETLIGSIPDGLSIDHLCETPCCCNPLHMEPVSPSENSKRTYIRHPVTHCINGHDLAVVGRYRSGKYGTCRGCHRDIMKRRRDANRRPTRRAPGATERARALLLLTGIERLFSEAA